MMRASSFIRSKAMQVSRGVNSQTIFGFSFLTSVRRTGRASFFSAIRLHQGPGRAKNKIVLLARAARSIARGKLPVPPILFLSGISFYGQLDDESGASAGLGFNGHSSAMVFGDNRIGDGRSKTRALPGAIRGEEWLENSLSGCLVHARAVVLDLDADHLTVSRKAASKPGRRGVYLAHGLSAVFEDVQKHLLDFGSLA